jgi:hypothetical protein
MLLKLKPTVNFTNIYQAPFCQCSFDEKILTQTVSREKLFKIHSYEKAACKIAGEIDNKVSMSPTFNKQLFHTEAFLYLQIGFVVFWRKEIGTRHQKITKPNVTREKLLNLLSYKKNAIVEC